ncbi:Fe(3+) ABC transporter substrate-binding protein [Pokkaliibacter sp. MBI-7]|uniref:Fe(3+) ABC transporter substrate-binding protein n=1 Tax=Pokkaliibacter sp. MBI-7 TaxID=3040600 RepID=UPI00244D61A4|nr:Fe(3+) ABC transporter substrate-binding protein [Pokkaliibacter sp. MBI-7]MDH2434441.1 Fe(3+) ABC transporter substrate-binding protein [Pokkaliibacter sp. MBI-7]
MFKPSVLLLTVAAFTTSVNAAEEVNVYSYRAPFLIQPMFDQFTQETGVKVNVVYADKGLLERLQNEGQNSPADLIMTVDIGVVHDVKTRGLSQPVASELLEQNIPQHFQDPDNHWFALTSRARLIYASKDRVQQGEITSYEQLADPKWQGRICTRSGKHNYNLGLIGSMISHHGEAEAEQWLTGVKANLARRPEGNDRAQIRAIAEGQCDLAIGNSYYFFKMLNNQENPEEIEWARQVTPIAPNQQDRGTHMNISGISLAKYAPHKDNAIKLMEFLSQDEAQHMYADLNQEFPVKAGVQRSELLQSYLGDFKQDELPLVKIAETREAASKLVDKVGFDN